jgi:hypothetical protein
MRYALGMRYIDWKANFLGMSDSMFLIAKARCKSYKNIIYSVKGRIFQHQCMINYLSRLDGCTDLERRKKNRCPLDSCQGL